MTPSLTSSEVKKSAPCGWITSWSWQRPLAPMFLVHRYPLFGEGWFQMGPGPLIRVGYQALFVDQFLVLIGQASGRHVPLRLLALATADQRGKCRRLFHAEVGRAIVLHHRAPNFGVEQSSAFSA